MSAAPSGDQPVAVYPLSVSEKGGSGSSAPPRSVRFSLTVPLALKAIEWPSGDQTLKSSQLAVLEVTGVDVLGAISKTTRRDVPPAYSAATSRRPSGERATPP